MTDTFLPQTDILSSVVFHLVSKIIDSTPYMQEFIEERDTNAREITRKVLTHITDSTKNLTLRDCCEILCGKYDDNFNQNKCVVYCSGKTRYKSSSKFHKHCGNDKEDDYVCKVCSETTEGQNISQLMQSNSFNQDKYRKEKRKIRESLAKLKLKNMKVDHFYVSSKLFVLCDLLLPEHVYFSYNLNLYVSRKYVNDEYKVITVGELSKEGKIRKVSYSTLLALKDIDIMVDVDTLSKKCCKILELGCVFKS